MVFHGRRHGYLQTEVRVGVLPMVFLLFLLCVKVGALHVLFFFF